MRARHSDIPIMPANPTARAAKPQSIPDTKVTQTLDSVKAALMTFPYIDLAILFGSMAKGTQRPDSDVDVGVLSKTPLDVEQRMELVDALALALGRPVDLIDLKLAGQPILNQILKHGVRICGSDTQMTDLVYRNLVDRADFLPLRNRILKGQEDTSDVSIITQKLASLSRCVQRIETVCPPTLEQLEQDIDAQDIVTLNLSRAVQLTVDISSHLLISNQAPAPQTMGDSFLGMEKLGVLDSDLALHLRKAVGFRNIAVHNYEAIHWAVVYSIVTERLGDFKAYASAVQAWVDKAAS